MSTTNGYVILNGASSRAWIHREFPGLVLGCNRLCEERELDICVAVDRMCVKHLVENPHQPVGEFWTKFRNLDLPEGWQHRDFLGVDSGSAAVEIALTRCKNIYIIGADGILGGSTETRYTYAWHPRGTRAGRHRRFRETFVKLHQQNPQRIWFVWDLPDPELNTLTKQEFNKYLYGQTPNNI